jgi:hypothetical protein
MMRSQIGMHVQRMRIIYTVNTSISDVERVSDPVKVYLPFPVVSMYATGKRVYESANNTGSEFHE